LSRLAKVSGPENRSFKWGWISLIIPADTGDSKWFPLQVVANGSEVMTWRN
jgi:hypothetical protein